MYVCMYALSLPDCDSMRSCDSTFFSSRVTEDNLFRTVLTQFPKPVLSSLHGSFFKEAVRVKNG